MEAKRLYELFLTEHPSDAISDDLRFFLAELENDQLEDYAAAAPLYRQVAERGGRYVHQARYDYLLAIDALRSVQRQGQREPTTAWDAPLIAACDWYVELEPESPHAPQVALRAAAIARDDGATVDAERRWRDLRRRWPGTEQAEAALDSLGQLFEDEGAVRRLAALSREVRVAGRDSAHAFEVFADSLIILSDDLRSHDRWAEAATLASEASLLVERPDLMNGAVELYLRAEEPDHALVAVDEFLSRWPQSKERGPALLISAMLNQRLGRVDAARERFAEASREIPPDDEAPPAEPAAEEGSTDSETVEVE